MEVTVSITEHRRTIQMYGNGEDFDVIEPFVSVIIDGVVVWSRRNPTPRSTRKAYRIAKKYRDSASHDGK